MRKRLLTLAIGATLLTGGAAAVTAVLGNSFVSAPDGVAIPFTHLALPPVVTPAPLRSLWGPTTNDLLTGNTIITSSLQANEVYTTLFSQSWDRSLVDFTQDYVILMGGGQMDISSFGITSIEEVDATWSALFFGGTEQDRFIAATATTTLPGIAPPVLPPLTWRVDAVIVPRTFFDDVVFHRTVIALP